MEHHVTRPTSSRKHVSAKKCGGGAGRRAKRRFAEEIDAKMALSSIQASDSSARKKTGAEKRYYLCDECNGYHLTSWDKPPMARAITPSPLPVVKKSGPASPEIEEALLAMFNEMFANLGSTEEYNAQVAHTIQTEVDKTPALLERIIINEVANNYLNVKAGELIAEVVQSTIRK